MECTLVKRVNYTNYFRDKKREKKGKNWNLIKGTKLKLKKKNNLQGLKINTKTYKNQNWKRSTYKN